MGRENHIPFVQLVDTQGCIDCRHALGGRVSVKQVNEKVIEDLRGRGLFCRRALRP